MLQSCQSIKLVYWSGVSEGKLCVGPSLINLVNWLWISCSRSCFVECSFNDVLARESPETTIPNPQTITGSSTSRLVRYLLIQLMDLPQFFIGFGLGSTLHQSVILSWVHWHSLLIVKLTKPKLKSETNNYVKTSGSERFTMWLLRRVRAGKTTTTEYNKIQANLIIASRVLF